MQLLPAEKPFRILDLGTGSGILAVTLLAERPLATGYAIDVSSAALAVALHNAETLQVADRVRMIESSWFANVEGVFDLIVSNPPYIPAGDVPGWKWKCATMTRTWPWMVEGTVWTVTAQLRLVRWPFD